MVSAKRLTDLNESNPINQRRATRYIRDDIKIVYYRVNLASKLGFKQFRKLESGSLLDISCKGALISSQNPLNVNDHLVLGLKFKTGKIFKIRGFVVRKHPVKEKIRTNTRNLLSIKLYLSRRSTLDVLVVNKTLMTDYHYGIKFYKYNDKLGEYLFKTQKTLQLK